MRLVVIALAAAFGCSAEQGTAKPATADTGAPEAAVVSRTQSFTTSIGGDGFSAPIDFTVPPGTRSITVVVSGAKDRLYALGAFRLGDGVERTKLDPATSYGSAMRDAYVTEQTGTMPGQLLQSIRLGTFTHVFPYAPAQVAVEGPASLRVVSDGTSGDVSVRIYMPEDDGARTLHLNAFALSETLEMSKSPAFLAATQKIFDQAEIRLVVDDAFTIKGSGLSSMLDFNEPQEPPTGGAAAIAALGASKSTNSALNVFVVDRLTTGVAGLSLGVPGPPERDSHYFGVIVRNTSDAELARTLAHELCHFLALQHVVNKGVSGKVYPDPIDDTEPGTGNLMENGTKLTAGQIFALTRSALLTKN